MSMSRITHLIEKYAAARGLSRSYVGRLAGGDGKLYNRLSNGGDVTTRTFRAIEQWFSDHWPADPKHPWPHDIPRPAPSPDSPAAQAAAGPTPPSGDPVAAVQAARERHIDAYAAGDMPAARRAEEEKFAAALQLGPDGCIASVEALCLALGVPRYVYDDVRRDFCDDSNSGRRLRKSKNGKPPSQTERMLTALVAAGDVRFASRRPKTTAPASAISQGAAA